MRRFPSRTERAKRAKLLADPEVERWHRRLEKSSPSTADVWPRRLSAFCVRVGKTPSELLTMKQGALIDLLDEFEAAERRAGRKGSYVAYTVKVVRSWLRYGGADLPRGAVKVRDADRVHEETALSKDQLRAVFNAASARERVAVSLMATAGLRPMVLGNYLGDDGLRLGDLPDVIVKGRSVSVLEVPARVVVRRELSKAGHVYTTFLGAEGVEYLRSYLETRLRGGERLGSESPVIVPERAKRTFIRTVNIGDLVRHALRLAELKACRPYVLRTTFATAMLTCESKGKIPRSFAQFFMGHKGDMTARYSSNRGLLPDDVIRELREGYKRCEGALSTRVNEEPSQRELKRALLAYGGLSDEEVRAEERKAGGELSWQRIVEIARERRESVAAQPAPIPPAVPGQQHIVDVDRVEDWIAAGWRFHSPLNGSKAVIEAPHSQ